MKTLGGLTLNELMHKITYRQRRYDRVRYKVARLNGKKISKHRKVAILALGKPLPSGAVVHHIDLDPFNNDPTNLVVCPNNEYRLLLIRRTKAVNRADTAANLVERLGLFKK